jgi:ferredoxin-NADP reductase
MDEIVVFHPLAQEILAGRFQPGETIDVSVANGDFVLMSAVTAELVD